MKQVIKFVIFAMACVFGFSAVSCTSDSVEDVVMPNEFEAIKLTEETRAAGNALSRFYAEYTTDAVRYVDDSDELKSKNVVVSPLSASILLSMVANGLDTNMYKEIIDYLGCDDMDGLKTFMNILLTDLPKADNQTNFILSNSVWVDSHRTLNGQYSSLIESIYNADISYVDIENNSQIVLNDINAWSAKKTNGLIPSILEKLDSETLAVLLNSMYFRAPWSDDFFNVNDTKAEEFHGFNKISKVDMMHTSIIGSYSNTGNFESISLPFGNSSFSIRFVLPTENVSMNEANSLLTVDELDKLNHGNIYSISISIPKFKLSTRINLNGVFNYSRISSIINANQLFTMFDPIVTGFLDLNQGSSIELNEKGAEVAATTSAGDILSAPMFKDVAFNLNRPFYFFIMENATGTKACLLSGRITDL